MASWILSYGVADDDGSRMTLLRGALNRSSTSAATSRNTSSLDSK